MRGNGGQFIGLEKIMGGISGTAEVGWAVVGPVASGSALAGSAGAGFSLESGFRVKLLDNETKLR
jgi:hypothetical protein